MDSRNHEDINRYLENQAADYARCAHISYEEAERRLSTVDSSNAYRHWIEDSVNGNNDKGCIWLIAIPLLSFLLYYGTHLLLG